MTWASWRIRQNAKCERRVVSKASAAHAIRRDNRTWCGLKVPAGAILDHSRVPGPAKCKLCVARMLGIEAFTRVDA